MFLLLLAEAVLVVQPLQQVKFMHQVAVAAAVFVKGMFQLFQEHLTMLLLVLVVLVEQHQELKVQMVLIQHLEQHWLLQKVAAVVAV
jgi:hypothetical protein